MKNIALIVATLSLLTLAACGDSGGSGGSKKAITKRQIDPSTAVTRDAPASIAGKEGDDAQKAPPKK